MRYLGVNILNIPVETEKLHKEKITCCFQKKKKKYLEKIGKLPNSFLGSNNSLPFSGLTYPLPRDPLNRIQRRNQVYMVKQWGKKTNLPKAKRKVLFGGRWQGRGEN